MTDITTNGHMVDPYGQTSTTHNSYDNDYNSPSIPNHHLDNDKDMNYKTDPSQKPASSDSHLSIPHHWNPIHSTGGTSLFHPTKQIHHSTQSNRQHEWTSRANRKNTQGHQFTDRKQGKNFLWYFWSWKPHLFSWWNASMFTIGSVFFVVESAAFFYPLSNSTSLAYGLLGLAGACLFTIGGTAQVLEVLQAPVEVNEDTTKVRDGSESHDFNNVTVDPSDNMKPEQKRRKPRTGFDIMYDSSLPWSTRLHVVFGQWYRIDYTLAVIQWVGTILFNINSVTTTGLFTAGTDPTQNPPIFWGLTIGPDIAASCTFVIAGYLQVIEATHRVLPDVEPNNIGWWAGYVPSVVLLYHDYSHSSV